jgi:ubiquinone/menaquinone biosynthesis C-methylase UbiE
MFDATTTNRYANDWNSYSAEWDERYGDRYQHLGDEWCDDGTSERQWELRLFAHTVAPCLTSETRALEIGPGGGKWTVRLAPRVRELVVFDVAEQMLDRTRRRVASASLSNVTFAHGNGRDMSSVASGSVDLVFSYDVFVHIALEDTVAYLGEIARILRDGGVAILHHAVNDVPPALDRIESHNEWYRDPANTRGQYYYYSRDALDRLYARAGLRIVSAWTDYCTTVITAERPADSIVPRLEQALRRASTAADDGALDAAAQVIASAGHDIAARLAALALELRSTPPGSARYALIQRIRRLVRG